MLDDDQTGVDRQERLCREVAARFGLVIGRVFVDNNRSAWQRNRKRPGWDSMLEAMRFTWGLFAASVKNRVITARRC